MIKIFLFLISIIFGSYFIYSNFNLSFFSNDEVVNIMSSNPDYKISPYEKEGQNFVGDSLDIYNITREKLLPVDVIDTKEEILIEEKDIIKNNIINISKENDANNLFLQLVSYKSINKAKKLIKFYKESSDPILNKLNLIIVTANLSERGTYYRVRVGPYDDIKEIYKLCLVLNVNNNECLIVKDKK